MRETTIKLFSVEELNENAQEKAIKWYNEHNDFFYLEEYLTEYLKELLKDNKIKPICLNVQYSLSYCQGDGFSFTGTFKWKHYLIYVSSNNNHYVHEKSVKIDVLTQAGNFAKDSVYFSFKELYEGICRKCAVYGYEIIEEEQNPINIKENMKANDYEFTKDGSFWRGY